MLVVWICCIDVDIRLCLGPYSGHDGTGYNRFIEVSTDNQRE